ncbi:DUF309 domain-containing protein [Marininema halotolerans]|uniref:DUF309 domain-containing protein n=1 Tax=Marininema halotolerans TaxID=1155944 RepID=A0A1I6PWX7_9BACL|nr:DUF309 domain-containing protein [Marininema halotolerans]SFS44716.1 hypothetical protein SAMN05444972_102192 [Marininema halotolerans]
MVNPLYLAFFQRYHEQEYWEAHEVLEELWQTQRDNHFYHGLIQVAAIMHQLLRGKVRGARKLATTAKGYFSPFPSYHEGVDLGSVRQWLDHCLRTLPENISFMDPEEVNKLSLSICPLPTPGELRQIHCT